LHPQSSCMVNRRRRSAWAHHVLGNIDFVGKSSVRKALRKSQLLTPSAVLVGDRDEGQRPWWFVPALIGALLGVIASVPSIETPVATPCALPGMSSDAVVARFLQRLGGSTSEIKDCWASGSLTVDMLDAYLTSRPPTSVSLVGSSDGPAPGVVILGAGAPNYVRWEVRAVWNRGAPAGWTSGEAHVFRLIQHGSQGVWKIEALTAP
jgi:hypothetical protein